MENIKDTPRLISIVTPCYNEEKNVRQIYLQIKKIFDQLTNYNYEHIFIDNDSKDQTQTILRSIASSDKNVKLIFNSRNFGHIRSPYYGMQQSSGDATILIVSDFQDPPELITDFIKKWEEGYEIVIGTKTKSLETPLMFLIRKVYYSIINNLAEITLQKNYTGFGLYDKKVIEIMKNINDPYPYLRGLVFEIGFNIHAIEYTQPERKRGITKNNFLTLYDMAMLGITNHSKIPLRIATILGFSMSLISFLACIVYFLYKLLFWDHFSVGIAPIVIGFFFFASIQLLFIGIIGEYIGFIHTKITNRPLVFERERINF